MIVSHVSHRLANANRYQSTVMGSRSLRIGAGVVVGDSGWLGVRRRISLGCLGVEWGEAAQCESEAGYPLNESMEMRLVGDRPGDLGLAAVGVERHAVERGGVARSEFSLDHQSVARR